MSCGFGWNEGDLPPGDGTRSYRQYISDVSPAAQARWSVAEAGLEGWNTSASRDGSRGDNPAAFLDPDVLTQPGT